jgi:putative CocE/NonD family hydrolase
VVAAAEQPVSSNPLVQPLPSDDFTIRSVHVPMRDGVNLHALILRPKGNDRPLPIMLIHTPYNAEGLLRHTPAQSRTRSPSLRSTIGGQFAELVDDGYVFVMMDIRGRGRSQGRYELMRMPHGPGSTEAVDASTDIYDSIDWLVANVGPTNGRLAIWGTSYSGRLALQSLLVPHSALKAVVAFNPVVDLWMGDDWYHQGAFRLNNPMEFIWFQDQSSWTTQPLGTGDVYDWHLRAGPNSGYAKAWFGRTLPYWEQLMSHPNYDRWWQDQALDVLLRDRDLGKVAVLNVHSWFDAEDIYGATAAYSALEARNPRARNYFVAGPCSHGQWDEAAGSTGPVRWNADTGHEFRRGVLAPFLEAVLHRDETPRIAEATVFETGANSWRHYSAWPPRAAEPIRLYLAAGGSISREAPTGSGEPTEFVSDPAKPVPYRSRPIPPSMGPDSSWQEWLLDDQRHADGRPDVLTFVSPPLTEDLLIVGSPTAFLKAATTGSDADWVIKLIDVHPDDYAGDMDLRGYQLMVSSEIQRGRFRNSFSRPSPIKANSVESYRIAMPHVNHRFRRGHRIMVQVQSTWFPVYDRNPQTYVDNIHDARPHQFKKATHSIWHNEQWPSYIEVKELLAQ